MSFLSWGQAIPSNSIWILVCVLTLQNASLDTFLLAPLLVYVYILLSADKHTPCTHVKTRADGLCCWFSLSALLETDYFSDAYTRLSGFWAPEGPSFTAFCVMTGNLGWKTCFYVCSWNLNLVLDACIEDVDPLSLSRSCRFPFSLLFILGLGE